ncbi:MAG: Txe/YoeB family addiction module toxin [Erysipelotrichaceae bacterium]|nr:Txe/YoeB family addiction module toxin [Erysipelotrichaceae bacterium]
MVVMWIIKFTKNAEKDKKLIKSAGLEERVKKLLNLIAKNPFQNPPSYEKLVGDLQGYYSRRINLQHRLVYKVYEDINTVVVHSMWSHCGDN